MKMKLTEDQVLGLVNAGFLLSREIKDLEEKLEMVKARLVLEADGSELEVFGTGCKCSVGYSARLASALTEKTEAKARRFAGEFFGKLFGFSPVAKFRDVAAALLGTKAGGELVAMLEGEPGARVTFRAV